MAGEIARRAEGEQPVRSGQQRRARHRVCGRCPVLVLHQHPVVVTGLPTPIRDVSLFIVEVFLDRIGQDGAGNQVTGQRPGPTDQIAQLHQVDEVLGGAGVLPEDLNGVGASGVERVQHAPLHTQHRSARRGRCRGFGQPGAASGVGGARIMGRRANRGPALGGMQGMGPPTGQEAVLTVVDEMPASGTAVLQIAAMSGAGEHDRQPPGAAPASAVAALEIAAVTGQAVRAIAGGPEEQPLAEVKPAAAAAAPRRLWSGPRGWVAFGVPAEEQRGRLAVGEAGSVGEPPQRGRGRADEEPDPGRRSVAVAVGRASRPAATTNRLGAMSSRCARRSRYPLIDSSVSGSRLRGSR